MNTAVYGDVTRVRHWLGLERNIVVVFGAMLVLGMGEELWIRYVPKYLEQLGATITVIAVYGALKDLLDAIYQYPGGWLADRLGRRQSLVIFALLAIVGYILYLIGISWQLILLGTLFVMAWSSLTLPAIFAIIGDALPKQRRSIGFGVQSILKRIPIVLAPPIGGLLIDQLGTIGGMRVGLAVTIVLALLAIGILQRSYVEQVPATKDSADIGTIWREMDGYLKRLLVADCLARWAEGIPKVLLILYFTNILGGSKIQFGWLTSLQMIAATITYIPVAKLADRMNRKPFVMITFALFALFPLVMVLSDQLVLISIAFMIAGLREIGEPARKALIVDLAREQMRGRAVGLYYLIRGLVVVPASLLGGWLWGYDPRWPFYAAFAIGMVGFVVYGLWGPGDQVLEPA